MLALAGVSWHYRFSIEKYFAKKLPALAQSPVVQDIKQDISTPPPLISKIVNSGSHLTDDGTINWTNTNRAQNGQLPALKENALLDQAAELKLQDLFKQQYFEHVNPQGVGPADLAKKVGYSFIAEGENLALGNFKDDNDLVTAWMNSPGHRANILNVHYTEIGVAVGQGTYEGNTTWIAVQEFGKPASSCPTVDLALKSEVTAEQADLSQLQAQITTLKSQMDAMNPQTQEEYDAYNKDVAEYNSEIGIYNNKLDVLKQNTSEYNAEVSSYNSCLAS